MLRSRSVGRAATLPLAPLAVGAVLLALLCGAWALARFASYTGMALAYSAPLDGQEGMALWEAGLLRSGRGLYVPVEPSSFVSAPYPPLHPLLLALFGTSATPHVFWAGRIISVVAALAVALAGWALARRITGSTLAGVAAAVLLLSFAPIQLWALRIKPDMTGLALTVAGLWFAARFENAKFKVQSSKSKVQSSKSKVTASRTHAMNIQPTLMAAAVAFVLAHFTKQTMLAGPLAAGTFLLLRDWRVALRWGVLYVALLAGTWLALDLATGGQYTFHIWVLHKLQWYPHRMWKLVAQLADAWPLIILGAVGLISTWRRPTVINAYLLWAPASLVGAGVIGSHHNHLLETGTALALAGAQAVGLGLTLGGVLRVLGPALLATQLLLWRAPGPWFSGEFAPDPDYNRYVEFVRATPGEVMADDVGLIYAAGRPLRYDDPAAMGPAATLGLWDQRQFVADIRAQRFSAIILRMDVAADGLIDPSGRWTPAMLQAVLDSYTLKFEDTLFIYVPK